ncbi:MAG: hypothetical protein FWD44_03670 [Oscillospiraceae bacterium]|nr:hypothetical protein [Oscillospiraceae bacterium]
MTINRSKSSLFLIEQLIAIAVFAICAVACIRIISTAYFYSRDSRDIGFAIIAAENAAENFKAVSGDFEIVADILGGSKTQADGNLVITVYYDNDWQITDDTNASFVLYLNSGSVKELSSFRLIEGNVSVERTSGDELISFGIAITTKG